MNRKVLLVGSLLALPLLFLLAVSFRFDPRAIDSPLIGQPAPGFALTDLDGRVVRLQDLRGRPVVINFWATWCQPCVVEHPLLVSAARQWADRAHFLGVIYQDDPELIRRFLRQRGAWGPSLIDPESGVAIAYGVYGAPETFVLDDEGRVVEKIVGLIDPRELGSLLDRLSRASG